MINEGDGAVDENQVTPTIKIQRVDRSLWVDAELRCIGHLRAQCTSNLEPAAHGLFRELRLLRYIEKFC
jgi:hypothetical protein